MSARISASGEYLRRTTDLPSPTNFTACGWCHIVNDRTGAYRFIFSIEDPSFWATIGWSQTTDNFYLSHTGAGSELTFASNPPIGDPFFWAMKCAGSGAGQLDAYWMPYGGNALDKVTGTMPSFAPTMVTWGNTIVDEWIDGRLSGLKMWDAVLTDAELLQEAMRRPPRRSSNLHGYWPVPAHTDLDDYSGNGRTLTAGGTLSTEDDPPRIMVIRTTGKQSVGSGQAVAVFSGTPIVGNRIVVSGHVWDSGGNGEMPNFSDGSSNVYDVDLEQVLLDGSGYSFVASALIENTTASLQVVLDTNVIDTSKTFTAVEVAGLDDNPIDVTASSNSDNTSPYELASGALALVDEVIFGALVFIGNLDQDENVALTTWGGITPSPVTVHTNEGPGIVGEFGAAGYAIRQSAASVTVGFQADVSNSSALCVVSYKAAQDTEPEGPITDGPKYHFLSGMRW